MGRGNAHYIRRFAKKSAVQKDGTVMPPAFEPRQDEATLSFTLRDQLLETTSALREFQETKALPSGDLPGLCFLTHCNLIDDLNPPLPPWHSADKQDEAYGHLHYSTDLPTLTQRNQMATQATHNGILLPAVLSGQARPP